MERRDRLRKNEIKYQEIWNNEQIFEANVDFTKEPFFVTFPYPYMNGRIHLGHAFTLLKTDIAVNYQRL
jgi:leucyl-tRNA synthetase